MLQGLSHSRTYSDRGISEKSKEKKSLFKGHLVREESYNPLHCKTCQRKFKTPLSEADSSPVVSNYYYLAWKTRTGSLTKRMTG